jgi:hypothetical protein
MSVGGQTCIRKASSKAGRKCSLHEFLNYVVLLAQDCGYTVASSHLDDDFMEVRLSTAEVIQFSRPELG